MLLDSEIIREGTTEATATAIGTATVGGVVAVVDVVTIEVHVPTRGIVSAKRNPGMCTFFPSANIHIDESLVISRTSQARRAKSSQKMHQQSRPRNPPRTRRSVLAMMTASLSSQPRKWTPSQKQHQSNQRSLSMHHDTRFLRLVSAWVELFIWRFQGALTCVIRESFLG